MEVIRFDLAHLPERREGLCLALGTFDGFHKGHQRLILESRLSATRHSGALLFSRSPAEVLSDVPYNCLMGLEDKIRFLNRLGVDYAYVIDADKDFYSLSPERFRDEVLSPLGVDRLIVGEDYHYGKDGAGDAKSLQECFDTTIVPLLTQNGEKISSTAVRNALLEGDIKKANSLLGRAYEIHGSIQSGFQNGRKLGFPTANIGLDYPYLLPKAGVYFALAYVHGLPHKAIVNIGCNPTFGKLNAPRVEAHLLDFSGDVYGKTLYLELIAYRREERKFASMEELSKAIKEDEEWARGLDVDY